MTKTVPFELLAELALDPSNGWSIGTFGAVGEFSRDVDEPVRIRREADSMEVVTPRGALRITSATPLTGVAWDTLSSDGETWGHALACCVPLGAQTSGVIAAQGADSNSIRAEDRHGALFDLGVGTGTVRMCIRTFDDGLIAAMQQAEGMRLADCPQLMGLFLRAQPHRVLTSPAGRIEVYQAIPAPDGRSPDGPHTHLLLKLIDKGAHSANTPIPEPLQSALTLHPRSPWRDSHGRRHAFEPAFDAKFGPLLSSFGLTEDAEIQRSVQNAVDANVAPEHFAWPDSRRGRAKARIVLRRLAAHGHSNVATWTRMYDQPQSDSPSR